jgi:methylglutaconyl-CoA hydratase
MSEGTNGSAPVRYRVDGPVARITLSDPARRNALTDRSLGMLDDALEQALDDPEVGVVVLGAEGPAFCSGADLSGDDAFSDDGPRLYANVLDVMRDATKPLVARVQGAVAGGGNGLVAACDVAVASTDARFAFAEVRVGVAPAVVAVVCLRRMRRADVVELMLTGERFDAERALAAGLVNRVAPAEVIDDEVGRVVDALLQGAPAALAVTKQLLRDLPGMEDDEAFRWASAVSAEMFGTPDAYEGRTAFAERRAPSWVRQRDV